MLFLPFVPWWGDRPSISFPLLRSAELSHRVSGRYIVRGKQEEISSLLFFLEEAVGDKGGIRYAKRFCRYRHFYLALADRKGLAFPTLQECSYISIIQSVFTRFPGYLSHKNNFPKRKHSWHRSYESTPMGGRNGVVNNSPTSIATHTHTSAAHFRKCTFPSTLVSFLRGNLRAA